MAERARAAAEPVGFLPVMTAEKFDEISRIRHSARGADGGDRRQTHHRRRVAPRMTKMNEDPREEFGAQALSLRRTRNFISSSTRRRRCRRRIHRRSAMDADRSVPQSRRDRCFAPQPRFEHHGEGIKALQAGNSRAARQAIRHFGSSRNDHAPAARSGGDRGCVSVSAARPRLQDRISRT